MGLKFLHSNSSFDEQQKLPMPDPSNYVIVKHKEINNHLVLKVKYPDCTNYEGEKILVFKNCTLEKLQEQEHIDPHFSESKRFYSPFARLEPTESGWNIACGIARGTCV